MTLDEYTKARQKIEQKFADDTSTLERAWVLLNGTNPPESPIVLREPDEDEAGVAAITGSLPPPPNQAQELHHAYKRRNSLKGLSDEEKKTKKAEYMRAWYKKHKGKK